MANRPYVTPQLCREARKVARGHGQCPLGALIAGVEEEWLAATIVDGPPLRQSLSPRRKQMERWQQRWCTRRLSLEQEGEEEALGTLCPEL
jgi:hypothetical protein